MGRKKEIAGSFKANPSRRYEPEDFPAAKVLAKIEDVSAVIGDAVTVDDLDELPISGRVKEIVRNGKIEGETKIKDGTRSAWRFDGVCGLLRAGVSPEAVVGILIDAQYEISSRVLELGEGGEQYARNEVERAMRKIAAAKAEELDEDFDEPIYTNAGDDEDETRTAGKVIVPTPNVWIDPAKISPRVDL